MTHPLSRRTALRLAAGASSVAALGATSRLSPAFAAPGVDAHLDVTLAPAGTALVLRISLDPDLVRRTAVWDLGGTAWTRVASTASSQVWTATPSRTGAGRVVVGTLLRDGTKFRDRLDYEVSGDVPSPPTTGGGALVGMNAPAGLWDQRVAEVGVPLGARRIFADLSEGPGSQMRLVDAAHADGMLPVLSYKVGADLAGALRGSYDAAARTAAQDLASSGLPVAVTVWHEPYKDMTGAQYTALSRRMLPIFRQGAVRVGPILNGWLLDNRLAEFEQFCPDELFDIWQYVAIDTYEGGTATDPGAARPGPRIPALSAYVRSRGYDLPLGVGEYNGYSAATLAEVGEAMFTTPDVWFGCVWNNTAEISQVLAGARLQAFRATASDLRAGSPRPL